MERDGAGDCDGNGYGRLRYKGAWGGGGGGSRTKSSSAAKPNDDFLGESFMVADISTRSRLASLLNSFSNVEMKGLRDIGLLPELSRLALAGEFKAGEGNAGEAARRKGLLEENSSCKPGEGRLSVRAGKRVISGASNLVTAQDMLKQARLGPLTWH